MNSIKALVETIDKLLCILSKKQKQQSIYVISSMLILSCLELLGVSTIYPLIQVMLSVEQLRKAWYISWLFAIKPNIDEKGILLFLCLVIIFVFVIKNTLAILLGFFQYKYCADFTKETSTCMMKSYLMRPYEFFVNTNSSIIIRGVGTDTNSVYQILLCLFQIIGEFITIFLIGAFLFITDWITAICAIGLAGLSGFIIIFGFKGKIKQAGKAANFALGEQYACAYQAVTGIKEISVVNRRNYFIRKYEEMVDKSVKASLVSNVVGICPDRILEGVCISGFIGIICIRILLGIEIQSFLPIIGSFAMGAFKILPSISKVSSRINTIIYNQPGLQNCYENISEARRLSIEREDIKRIEDSVDNYQDDNSTNVSIFRDKLELRNVVFKYASSTDSIINDVSIDIKKGESVAFVGSSGAGKTTLADIILGLYEPQHGAVFIDGQDIRSIKNIWSRTIGYVPQSVFLIDDTIRSNVAFGLPQNSISDERVWYALKQAQLQSFVDELPRGLDTIVGERGVRFSGGQKQRIALARALYDNPDILVLDEATSALDIETENAVMDAIDALQGQKTLIIIAHRLTTIRNCDRIFEITEGKAIERKHEYVFGGEL